MYYIDTPTQTVDAFTVKNGTELSDRRTCIDIPKDQGFPDGCTIDS